MPVACNEIQVTADYLMSQWQACETLNAEDMQLLIDLVIAVNSCTEGNLTQDNMFLQKDFGNYTDGTPVEDAINAIATYTVTETQIVVFTGTKTDADSPLRDNPEKERWIAILKGKDTYGSGGTQLLNSDLLLLNPIPEQVERNSTVINNLYQGTRLLYGNVTWDNVGLQFTSTPIGFMLSGQVFEAPAETNTLSAAHPTLDRIDVFAVDRNNGLVIIEGTPAATPAEPTVDFADQLRVAAVSIPAGATTPGGITIERIYDEGVGEPSEWTVTSSDPEFNLTNTEDPYLNTNAIKGTSVGDNDTFSAENDAEISPDNMNNLTFRIKNSTATDDIKFAIHLYNSADVLVGNVLVSGGDFGYDDTNTSTYQTVIIPKASFNLTGDFDRVDFIMKPELSETLFIDDIYLLFGLDATSTNTQTYLGLDDTADSSYTNKNGYVPLVTNEEELTLTQLSVDNIPVDTTGNIALQSPVSTGTELDLSRVYTTWYNVTSASAALSYTTINAVPGGQAISLINTTSEPTVVGGTKEAGADWVANTELYLMVYHNGNEVRYRFDTEEDVTGLQDLQSVTDQGNVTTNTMQTPSILSDQTTQTNWFRATNTYFSLGDFGDGVGDAYGGAWTKYIAAFDSNDDANAVDIYTDSGTNTGNLWVGQDQVYLDFSSATGGGRVEMTPANGLRFTHTDPNTFDSYLRFTAPTTANHIYQVPARTGVASTSYLAIGATDGTTTSYGASTGLIDISTILDAYDFEWVTYTGTRAGGNLVVTIGDFDSSNNGIRIVIDDANEDIQFLSTNYVTAGNIFRIESTNGSGIYGSLTTGSITADRTYTFPDIAGTLLVGSLGNDQVVTGGATSGSLSSDANFTYDGSTVSIDSSSATYALFVDNDTGQGVYSTTTTNHAFQGVNTGTLAPFRSFNRSSGTADVVDGLLIVRETTGGTAAKELGSQIRVEIENSAGAVHEASEIRTVWENAGVGSEQGRMDIYLSDSSVLTRAIQIFPDTLIAEGVIRTNGYIVSGLPTGVTGDRAYVTDANSTTFGSTVAGGGSNTVPVFYDGSNWIIA